MPRIAGYLIRRARPYARRAPLALRGIPHIPALFGGARAGQRQRVHYLDEQGLGDDTTVGFNASVEAWRSDVEAQMATKPLNFLLAWIQKESNGNPCSWTSLQEAGIYQLMAGDNITQGGTTIAQMHPVPPCTAGVQTTAYRSSLSDDQAYEQVRAGMQYIDYCITRVDAYLGMYGYAGQPGWSTSDWSYWAMVKMVHVAPAKIPSMLQAGINGYGSVPPDWDTMMQYVTGIPASWTDNARWVGQYGQGGGTVFNKTYLLYGGMAVGALALIYLARKGTRHLAHT